MALTLDDAASNDGMGTGPTPNGKATAIPLSLLATFAFELARFELAGGGSAIPCGLVLPTASA